MRDVDKRPAFPTTADLASAWLILRPMTKLEYPTAILLWSHVPGRVPLCGRYFVRGAVKRREFITLLAGALAWPARADSETSRKRPLIAVLSAITRVDNSPLTAFVDGLKDLGYVEGQNVEIALPRSIWTVSRRSRRKWSHLSLT